MGISSFLLKIKQKKKKKELLGIFFECFQEPQLTISKNLEVCSFCVLLKMKQKKELLGF